MHGHLVLTVAVPRTIKLSHGRATAVIAMSAVTNKGRAHVTRVLSISDMVLSVASSPIVNCIQTLTVHVSYHPNVPLRIVLLFPHNHQLTLMANTNGHSVATVSVDLDYAKAPNPLRVGVEAINTSVRPPRLERIAFAVALPPACHRSAQQSNGP
jgi:hypothetical protein